MINIYIYTVWRVKSQQQVFSRNSENINFSSIHPSSARQYNGTHIYLYIYKHYTAGIRPACTRYTAAATERSLILYMILYIFFGNTFTYSIDRVISACQNNNSFIGLLNGLCSGVKMPPGRQTCKSHRRKHCVQRQPVCSTRAGWCVRLSALWVG